VHIVAVGNASEEPFRLITNGCLWLKKWNLWSRQTGDWDVPKGWGIGRDKVEGKHCGARPVAIHLISLELAVERVWMPSKVACCLSNLCMAAMTLSS